MVNGHCNGFTGKIIYPVVIRSDEKIEIKYRTGERKSITDDEDISLTIEAHEKTNGSYDVRVDGKLVANADEFNNATETMREYIDPKTGKLKQRGLEKTLEKIT